MNKREFLAKLEKALAQLNREERKRQLDYYEEMINDRIDEGMSEEEAVHRMGTVQGVAAKILSEASPEQMKKKRKISVLGWIGIVLGALILITAVLAAVFMFDVAEDSGMIPDVEDMIEQRLELEGGWILGSGDSMSLLEADKVNAIDIVWAGGDVIVSDNEANRLGIKCSDDKAIQYQIKEGTLYIETVENYNGKAKLTVYIPEDGMLLESLNIVSSSGKVLIDEDNFRAINVVTSVGDVRINPDDAESISVVTSAGDVLLELEDDDAFVMNYAVAGGDVKVGFDRSFRNESGNGESASYDHSFGRANCLKLDITTADGDIRLLDD